jgi:hypothetical protein
MQHATRARRPGIRPPEDAVRAAREAARAEAAAQPGAPILPLVAHGAEWVSGRNASAGHLPDSLPGAGARQAFNGFDPYLLASQVEALSFEARESMNGLARQRQTMSIGIRPCSHTLWHALCASMVSFESLDHLACNHGCA